MDTKPKLLIVDDERMNINVLADLLKPNYKIMAAISGEQALKAACGASPPDLILLDVMMPEMDGFEVCRRLKADPKTCEIPVMFVTAMGQEKDETKGLELGAVDYITKPIVPAVVEARVRSHVALRRSVLELREAYQIIELQRARMQDELNVARNIQMSMLPLVFPPFPERNEFTVFAKLIPAREVGGDLYDFFFIDDKHLCLCVGDVAGKGVPAALFMAVTRSLIKAISKENVSPANIMSRVNDELSERNESCTFVTVFLGVVNVETGEFRYTNAGHNPPYVRHADATITCLDQRNGPVVGFMPELEYTECNRVLAPEDVLVIYTDGVTEAMNANKKLYSDQRLEDLIRERSLDTVEQALQVVLDDVDDHVEGAEQSDDITVLTFRYNGPQSRNNSFKISVPNQLSSIHLVTDKFESFCTEHGLPDDVVRRINVVFDELLSNIVSYGFDDDGLHEIDVHVSFDGQRLVVEILDDGRPFDPFLQDSPDTTLTLEEREVGGLGIHLVRKMMDEVAYERRDDKNAVRLVKRCDEK